jgi:nucleotide-binding universal stress UspA family protein
VLRTAPVRANLMGRAAVPAALGLQAAGAGGGEEAAGMISHVLVAIDGSTHAIAAVDLGCDVASKYGARVTLLHAVRESEAALLPKDMLDLVNHDIAHHRPGGLPRELVHEVLRRAEDRARAHGVADVATALEAGDPAERIVDFARANGVNLIVMGQRGLSGLKGLLIGSVSNKVLHLAECACLLVK